MPLIKKRVSALWYTLYHSGLAAVLLAACFFVLFPSHVTWGVSLSLYLSVSVPCAVIALFILGSAFRIAATMVGLGAIASIFLNTYVGSQSAIVLMVGVLLYQHFRLFQVAAQADQTEVWRLHSAKVLSWLSCVMVAFAGLGFLLAIAVRPEIIVVMTGIWMMLSLLWIGALEEFEKRAIKQKIAERTVRSLLGAKPVVFGWFVPWAIISLAMFVGALRGGDVMQASALPSLAAMCITAFVAVRIVFAMHSLQSTQGPSPNEKKSTPHLVQKGGAILAGGAYLGVGVVGLFMVWSWGKLHVTEVLFSSDVTTSRSLAEMYAQSERMRLADQYLQPDVLGHETQFWTPKCVVGRNVEDIKRRGFLRLEDNNVMACLRAIAQHNEDQQLKTFIRKFNGKWGVGARLTDETAVWLRQTFEATHNSWADFVYAVYMERNLRVPNRIDLAWNWYERSALEGNALAANNLAVFLLANNLVNHDDDYVVDLLHWASSAGVYFAKRNVHHLETIQKSP